MQTQTIYYCLLGLGINLFFFLIFYLVNLLGPSAAQTLQFLFSNILCHTEMKYLGNI